ncbi:hypothetical protein BDF22DRAFT_740383 [Syncephalis plumigaleata]|nr:hypothetical protein BDF22DRAFT_740383 [Syncephalis plumigaleata]
MGQLTDDQWSVIYVATVSTAAFSMLCAIVTIIAYFRLKNYHNAVSGPACCMACAELVSMSAYCVGRFGPLAGDTSSLCQWQAVFEQIGDLSSILWTGCIALDLLLIMFFGYSVAQVRRLHFRVYAPICIILPLLISLVPLHVYSVTGTPFYGSSGLWCG